MNLLTRAVAADSETVLQHMPSEREVRKHVSNEANRNPRFEMERSFSLFVFLISVGLRQGEGR